MITFSPMLGQFSGPDFVFSWVEAVFRLIISAFFLLLSIALPLGIVFLIHFLFSLPMRRAERARLFLNLMEDAIHRGQMIEEMILSLAQSRDLTVGIRFYLLAAHIESGLKLGEALKKVPRLLPPQISAMLRAGEKLGDLKRVLPACHEILRDRPAGVRSAIHYMILVVLVFSPVFICVVILTAVFVIPKFKDVAGGMGIRLGSEAMFVFGNTGLLVGIEIIISIILALIVLFYIGGPQFTHRLQFRSIPVFDWIAWHVPWKQKRLQRTFSAMLAVLLDGGVPEGEAVRMASDCTSNEICRRHAHRLIAALERGEKLDDAVRTFDDTGEFHWRLANATHSHGGFLYALRGWHEALDAKAFQQEEAAAHVITTGVVILNGVFVALIATAMFGILVMFLKSMLRDL